MEKSEVIAKILQLVPDAQVQADGADCSFMVTVISDTFANVSAVKRQQTILAGFSDLITSGSLHALTVKAYTPSEWATFVASQASGLTQLM